MHPLLFAVHAVLSFYASNIAQAEFGDALRSLLMVVVCSAAGFALLWRLLGDAAKAGVMVSLSVLLFFSYDLYSLISVQLILITVLVNWLTYFIVKSEKHWGNATIFLNAAAFVALAFPLWIMTRYALESRSQGTLNLSESPSLQLTDDIERPNIYYIILDGYGRADVLEDLYQYPANTYMDILRAEGFYIADKSRSNYVRTIFSLASSFNMDTLETFIESNNLRDSHDERYIRLYNYESRFGKILRELGYTTVALSSGYLGGNSAGMEHFETPSVGTLNQFELKLLGQTPVHEFLQQMNLRNAFDTHRARQIEALARIPKLAQDYPSPTFFFGHIFLPHPPFVFEDDGTPADPKDPNFHIGDADYLVNITMTIQEYQESYKDQLHYLNHLALKMVKEIRASDPEAVIVLQGDHGPGSQYVGNSLEKTNMHERTGILNAFLFPDGDYSALYPEISPANSFRVISNHFFGADFELVEDKVFFSSTASAYDFVEVPLD